jgi:hypothetical protein
MTELEDSVEDDIGRAVLKGDSSCLKGQSIKKTQSSICLLTEIEDSVEDDDDKKVLTGETSYLKG